MRRQAACCARFYRGKYRREKSSIATNKYSRGSLKDSLAGRKTVWYRNEPTHPVRFVIVFNFPFEMFLNCLLDLDQTLETVPKRQNRWFCAVRGG